MVQHRSVCAVAVIFIALTVAGSAPTARAQDPESRPDRWATVRRGSWLRRDTPQPNDVVLDAPGAPPPVLVVSDSEASCVRQAVRFLATDLAAIAGREPVLAAAAPAKGPRIVVLTAAGDPRWEAYDLEVGDEQITIRGSNPRGTAFGVYELCERLGVDPLHHWSGIEPERVSPLVVRSLAYHQAPPAVRFRGLFHDDEDILPEPRLDDGKPDQHGVVPVRWYERYFETALRLRLNMVAPWVRVTKPVAVQKLASEWGLYYTSHHYDTLLSDPYHFERVPRGATRGLAAQRGVEPKWDWQANREGLIRFWRGGVEENRELDCIWPLGMRGTNDYSYRFPKEWTEDQRLSAYREALETQVNLVRSLVAPGREALFHFTMYTEMLGYFQTGKLPVPDDVIIVWPDDNDGRLRALPPERGEHRHGVYYHLAYLGGQKTAQTHQVTPPGRIEEQFRAILAAGCTEFFLTNVSELREYVLGVRLLADLQWDGPSLLHDPAPRSRAFLAWWCREYFGDATVAPAGEAYAAYFDLLPDARAFHVGAEKCLGALASLEKKLHGEVFTPAMKETMPALLDRSTRQAALETLLERTRTAITSAPVARFFFENLELAAAIDRCNTSAAILLVRAMDAEGRAASLDLCRQALVELDQLDLLLRRAERPPFTNWYGPTWIAPRNVDLVEPRRLLIGLLAGAERPR